jgi:hypothetical protein
MNFQHLSDHPWIYPKVNPMIYPLKCNPEVHQWVHFVAHTDAMFRFVASDPDAAKTVRDDRETIDQDHVPFVRELDFSKQQNVPVSGSDVAARTVPDDRKIVDHGHVLPVRELDVFE